MFCLRPLQYSQYRSDPATSEPTSKGNKLMNTSKKLTAAAAALVGLGMVALSAVGLHPASAQTPPFHRPLANGQERHPELRKALRTLERTETDLRHSVRDFGGHREKAADLCHQAELEIQQALAYDKH